MEDPKAEIDRIKRTMRERGVTFPDGRSDDETEQAIQHLQEIEFQHRSPGGEVTAFISAAGSLLDVVIDHDAMDRLNHQEMGAVVSQTVRDAESRVRTAISDLQRSQSGGTR